MEAIAVQAVGAQACEALAAIHARAFEAPWDARALAELLGTPLVFALQGGAPALGFILARAVAGEAEILTLAVDPAARRRGLGARLVQEAAAVAGDLGAEVVWLEVAEDNEAARALYAALGFEAAGRRPRYYARPGGAVDALILRRELNTGSR